MGLSDTSSAEAGVLIFWMALALITAGSSLIGRETLGKIASLNEKDK